jgi:hypothetical protein
LTQRVTQIRTDKPARAVPGAAAGDEQDTVELVGLTIQALWVAACLDEAADFFEFMTTAPDSGADYDVIICDRCITEARQVAVGNPATGTASLVLDGPRAFGRCGFCGRDRGRVARLVTVDGGSAVAGQRPGKYATALICNDCLDLCDEIIASAAHRRPRMPILSKGARPR